MNNYKELIVWQKSIELAVMVYHETQNYPRSETFGLTAQSRRSAVSIASNIAEGAGRSSKKDFGNFIGIANASSCELETQLILANRVNLLSDTALASLRALITEIQKMNWSLKRSMLKAKPSKDEY
ncbi:MAG TPA: four helix bundle protein [Chryseolinea sp.]